MAQSPECKSGIDFIAALGLGLIGLKLLGVLDWSWWFVLMPLWWPVLTVVAAGLTIVMLGGWHELVEILQEAWRRRPFS